MNGRQRKFVSSALILVGAAIALGPLRFELVKPHLGAPAILMPGSPLTLEIANSLPFWRPSYEVRLEGPTGRHQLEVERREDRWRGTVALDARLPEDITPGRFDLVVSVGDRERRRPAALHVVDQFSQRIKLLQIADLPYFGDDAAGDRAMREIVEEINLVAPAAVLLTGDIVYTGGPRPFERLLAALENLEPPLIAAPGNHEYDHWADYRRHFVEPWHVVDLGPYFVVSLNSGHGRDQLTQHQLGWLRRELADRPGRTPIIQVHHPLFGERSLGRSIRELQAEAKEGGWPVVLSGHLHGERMFDIEGNSREDTWVFAGPRFAVTTAAGEHDRNTAPTGYRLVRLDAGRLVSLTYDADGDGILDPASSHPFGRLRAERPGAHTALVHNELNEIVEGARVRFELPLAEILSRPDRGRLAATYQRNKRIVFVVELDLPPKSTTRVRMLEPAA